MILSRNQFYIGEKCVIEKLIIRTPLRFPAVFQNEACFLYFKSGETVLHAPVDKWHIKPTEGVLLKCGHYFVDMMQHAQTGKCEVYAIHLYPEILRDIYQDEIPSFIKYNEKQKYVQKISSDRVFEKFIDGVIFYFENPGLVNDEILRLKLKELILLLMQSGNAKSIMDLFTQLFNPYQVAIEDVIHTHLYDHLTTEEMAKLAGLSVSSFKRSFKKIFNDTPANYIREKRLLRAAQLLTITDLLVSEIAYQVGFKDVSHFSKSFHKKFQCVPSEYRHNLAV